MKPIFQSFLAVLILCSFTLVQSQRTPVEQGRRETVQREQLQKLLSKVGVDVVDIKAATNQPQTYRELKIRLGDATNKSETGTLIKAEQQTQSPSVAVLEDNKRSGTLPRHRSLELASTHIFIAAVDATNKLRWWSIMPDPRVVRAETQTQTGELRSQDYYVANVTFAVAFPDDPEITSLRIYHPVWSGTEFDLKPLAVVPTR